VSPAVSRTLTLFAAAVLAFDGAALMLLGWWGKRGGLSLIGAGFFVSSGVVLLYWRWYRKRLLEILAARRELNEDAREMQHFLGESDATRNPPVER
jgi:predicted alpha/beta hydrolase